MLFGESSTISHIFSVAISFIGITYPIWLPLLLIYMAWELWVQYVRALFFHTTEYVVLEVKLPRDITKSPQAMETAIATAFYQTGNESTFIDRYWHGKSRAIASLELASFGGEVHFFIWARSAMRNIIESQLYAQYPGIEIYEVPDYTQGMMYDKSKVSMWGTDYKFTKSDALPIKTYIDYGLDKDPKEEMEVNPVGSVLEFMGSLKPGENVWFQLIIRAHKKEKRGGPLSKKTDVQNDVEDVVKEMIKKSKLKNEDEDSGRGLVKLSPGETDIIKAMERNANKLLFDVGVRAIYIAKNENFTGTNIPGVIGLLRPFNTTNMNEFRITRWTDFDYPWQDFRNIRKDSNKRKILKAFKLRSWFFPPFKHKSLVMSAEELATIYHFPGAAVATPTFTRIPSKKAQPPANLPV